MFKRKTTYPLRETPLATSTAPQSFEEAWAAYRAHLAAFNGRMTHFRNGFANLGICKRHLGVTS